MKHFINVQEPYYSLIISGKKTIEGRLNKGKFKEIRTGDFIVINNAETFKVKKTVIYSGFEEMIKAEGIDKVIPDKKSIKEAVSVYYRFYTKDQEREFGVLAIGIEAI